MSNRDYAVDRYRNYPYFTITAKGIKYLSTTRTYPWVQYLPSDLSRISIFPESRKPTQIAYSIRCGNTLLLALNAGANISDYLFSGSIANSLINPGDTQPGTESLENDLTTYNEPICTDDLNMIDLSGFDGLDDEDEETLNSQGNASKRTCKSLAEIKRDVISKMKDAGQMIVPFDTSEITFFSTKELKARLYDASEKANCRPDFRYGKYTGALITPAMSILLYHAEHDGMRWEMKIEEMDINTLCLFSRYCSPYNNAFQGNLRAGVIIDNPISFINVVTDRYHKRRVKDSLGGKFNALYLIPQSPNGSKLLSWISTNSQKSKQAYADMAVSKQMSISTNMDGRCSAFRLKSDDCYLLDGFEMDYKIIRAAVDICNENPDLHFKVICFPWQQEYYKKLWPQIETVPI